MIDLIGEANTSQLLETGNCYVEVEHDEADHHGNRFHVRLNNGVYDMDGNFYCIDAAPYRSQHTVNGMEFTLSMLYPKLALLLTNPELFFETACWEH